MFGEWIMEVLTILVQVALLIVGGYIVQFIGIKIEGEKLNNYYSIAKKVVTALEQTIGGGNGPDKKQEAIQALKSMIKEKLSDEEIDKLIEAAVFEMNRLLNK
ncbi:MAG: phage holin [Clostridiaceae bacterium]|nr:phage holin [Clostridiaceae bacterium]